jgi:hypothetical protein
MEIIWCNTERISVEEVGESIEMIFRQTAKIREYNYLPEDQKTRIFKIIYSCVDGKWNKSERIYGKIIPKRDEYFDFTKDL